MRDFSGVITNVSVTSGLRLEATALALKKNLIDFKFRTLLINTERSGVEDGIEFVKTDKPLNSRNDYSQFMIENLADFIDTEYCLVSQWDSWIINPHLWSEEFLKYDYIGAPFPDRDVVNHVGNGGFSLRSKRLLKILKTSDYGSYRAKNEGVSHPDLLNEDVVICRLMYDQLNQLGIRFAPLSLAVGFCFEYNLMGGMNTLDYLRRSFGFHGEFNFHFLDKLEAAQKSHKCLNL